MWRSGGMKKTAGIICSIFTTPAGTAAAEQSLLLQKGYWENLLQDLTAEEKTTLNALLEKMERRAARVVVPKDRNGQGPFQQDEI